MLESETPAAPSSSPPPAALRIAFAVGALGFLGGAVAHVIRGLTPTPDDPSGPARHALFVAIDLALALGLLTRPRWLVFPFAALLLQQLGTHGVRAATALLGGQAPRLDDVLVCLFLPTMFGLVVHDRRRQG